MTKRGRGRPRKVKTFEQYTVSELRDMPMSLMVKLFFSGIVGKKAVVVTSLPKSSLRIKSSPVHSKRNKGINGGHVAKLMDMPLDKKADYLADSLMQHLKKTK